MHPAALQHAERQLTQLRTSFEAVASELLDHDRLPPDDRQKLDRPVRVITRELDTVLRQVRIMLERIGKRSSE